MSVYITLVGRVAVEVDGLSADATKLPGRRAALTFAYLVAERDRPVPHEELADAVWDGALPRTWQPALRGLVSKAREFLNSFDLRPADLSASIPGCYQLTLPTDTTVDVELVASEVDIARRALQAGDLMKARAAAQRVCEIARRLFLPGHDGAWVEARRATLRQMLVTGLEVLVDSNLAAGQGQQAVVPASELVDLDPFRDSAHERLLRAYAVAGDRGEALRVYDRYRGLLADELGVGPSPEVEAVYVRVLQARSETPSGQVATALLPSPAASAAGSFTGRRSEVDRLLSAWLDAQHGGRRTVLIAGEAGIGKTRLAAELAGLVERDGDTVLTGRCDHHLGVPYLPVREALGRHLAAVPRDRLHALLGASAVELVQFWPELAWRSPTAQPLARTDPDVDHHLLYDALMGVLEAIAVARPVLLVVDDVHGADEASLLLLRSLARARRPANLMTLLTYRDDESTVRPNVAAALGDLLRAPGVEILTLDGLTVDEVASIVSATLGGPLNEGGMALARVLRERTGGNPFFVSELLQHLSGTGALANRDLTAVATGPAVDDVPERLRWVINQRLAGQGSAAEQAIAAIAVIGHQSDPALLARVVDLSADDLSSALDTAVKAKLLEEHPTIPRRYGFRHALVRDLVYRGLPADESERLHRRVGESLEDMTGDAAYPAELADHFALAGDGLAERAVRYASRAGEQAFAEHRYEESARRFRQALFALDRVGGAVTPMGRRCDLFLKLGQAWTAAGETGLASEAYLRAADAARVSGAGQCLANAALGVGGPAAFWSTEVDRDALIRLLQEALDAVGTEDGVLQARLLARLAGWQAVSALLEPEGALAAHRSATEATPSASLHATFSDAVAMARRIDDRRTLAAVLADQELTWSGMLRPDGPVSALHSTAELDLLAVELGDESLAYRASLTRAGALLAAGDLNGVDRLAERVRRIADERHARHNRWLAVILAAVRAMVVGDFRVGEGLAEDALEIGRGPLGDAATFAYGAHLVFLLWLQGRPADVEAVLDRLIADQRPSTSVWRRLLPLAYVGQGRDASARRHLDAATENGLAGRSIAELVALVGACAQLHDGAAADQLYRLLAPWSGHHLSAGHIYLGATDHHLAILAATAGQPQTALRHFRVAAGAHRRLGARPWQALTSHAYADMLRDHGGPDDRHRADVMAAAACATARVIGMELPG